MNRVGVFMSSGVHPPVDAVLPNSSPQQRFPRAAAGGVVTRVPTNAAKKREIHRELGSHGTSLRMSEGSGQGNVVLRYKTRYLGLAVLPF